MSRRSFAFIHRLSLETTQPPVASQAMYTMFTANLKLIRKTSTFNFLNQLVRKRIGTNDAEILPSLISGQLTKNTSSRKLVLTALRIKVSDATKCRKEAKREFIWSKRECYKVVRPGTVLDGEFRRMMFHECGQLWYNLKEQNRQKLDHLWMKYGPQTISETRARHEPAIRGVKYRDIDLREEFDDKNEEAAVYGDVNLSKEAASAATLNPKLMDYQKINKFDMMVNCEKGAAIMRYNLMGKQRDEQTENEQNENEQKSTETLDLENKVLNQGNRRATDIPTVQSYVKPQPSSIKNENSIQNALDGFERVIDRHIKEIGDKTPSVLTQEEKIGIKEIKKKISDKEWVVFKSDKSGRLTVDSIDNYSKDLKTHTETDTVITRKDLEHHEEIFNKNLKTINKVFGVGCEHGDRNVTRVNDASISTNIEPPVMRGQRKDHKDVPPGGVTPMRALCGGTEAPNARLGHGVGAILTNFLDGDPDNNEMKSSEEMRSKFSDYNENVASEVKKRAFVTSMDAKALYPSVKKSVAREAIIELIDKSDLEVRNIDYWEGAKYIAILCSAEEI